MSKNKNAELNHSFMCHQTKGIRKTVTKKNATYIVESIFRNTGPTITDCVAEQIKRKIGEI